MSFIVLCRQDAISKDVFMGGKKKRRRLAAIIKQVTPAADEALHVFGYYIKINHRKNKKKNQRRKEVIDSITYGSHRN